MVQLVASVPFYIKTMKLFNLKYILPPNRIGLAVVSASNAFNAILELRKNGKYNSSIYEVPSIEEIGDAKVPIQKLIGEQSNEVQTIINEIQTNDSNITKNLNYKDFVKLRNEYNRKHGIYYVHKIRTRSEYNRMYGEDVENFPIGYTEYHCNINSKWYSKFTKVSTSSTGEKIREIFNPDYAVEFVMSNALVIHKSTNRIMANIKQPYIKQNKRGFALQVLAPRRRGRVIKKKRWVTIKKYDVPEELSQTKKFITQHIEDQISNLPYVFFNDLKSALKVDYNRFDYSAHLNYRSAIMGSKYIKPVYNKLYKYFNNDGVFTRNYKSYYRFIDLRTGIVQYEFYIPIVEIRKRL